MQRRPIIQLLFASSIDFEILDQTTNSVLESVPEIKTILQYVLDFRILLKGDSLLELDNWLDKVKKLDNKHLNSFINGVERDKDAIQNSIIYPKLSNGLAEGKVNKLKTSSGRCLGGVILACLNEKCCSLKDNQQIRERTILAWPFTLRGAVINRNITTEKELRFQDPI